MNLRDLKYLLALAEHKHFGKAAEACFVSQPALSMQIKKLEKYLGVQLLERTNKTVLLTAVGHEIARYAQKIHLDIEEMRAIAKAAMDPLAGELKMGLIPTVAPYLLPHIMPLITAKLPRLELYLIEEQTHVLMGRLLRGEIDVAILSPLGNEKELICHDLYDEAFLLAVPQMHPWAAFQSIQQASLCDQALLLLEDGHCMRDQALAVCQLSNASEIKNFRASSLETLRYMVASGRGVTLFPQLAIRQYDNIVYIPFAEPRPRRKISMLWRTTSAKHDLLQKMAEMLQTYCATKFS